MDYDISNPVVTEQIRKLEVTDPCHADTFNTIFEKLVNNDVALKKNFGDKVSTITNDISQVIFQLALQGLISTSGMKHVFIDKIENAADVNLLQGMYTNGKVYI
ncbi:hypothetical protein Ccar_16465 [Clostridium carboxidivorans P7]|uniref:hypothetical protein n=1 Tax=Clostridium carboxidivorans TaxID=217159 RepID=UPI00064FE1D5|nr:hypothetical protein [Clostridium carboxidivorans]AKN32369.1 hypothetical protein Ccar_16465 [Clostridium carboxidivorans P7]